MKSKSPLTLMEMLIMVAVFALAAAICVKVMVKSYVYAAEGAALDRAVLMAENAAEVLRCCDGDKEEAAGILGGTATADGLTIIFDEDWNETEMQEAEAFRLTITEEDSQVPGLGKAVIFVSDRKEHEMFTIPVGWQKKVDEK